MLLDQRFDRMLRRLEKYDEVIEMSLNCITADFTNASTKECPSMFDRITKNITNRINSLESLIVVLQAHQITMLEKENNGSVIILRLPLMQEKIDHYKKLKLRWEHRDRAIIRNYVDKYVLKVI